MEWDDLYAQVSADTGWAWAEVGRLTVPRYRALCRFWSAHPPLHRMVAAYLGVSRPQPKNKPEDFAAFFQEMTGRGVPG